MIYHNITSKEEVQILPETVMEAGLFQWLAARFSGRTVTIVFDTTNVPESDFYPCLWIAPTTRPTHILKGSK